MDDALSDLISIIEDVAMGKYSNDIMEFTRPEHPEMIRRIAEAMGMMMVRVESREMRAKVLLDEVKASYFDTINRLVLAAEYKDEDTGDHIVRLSLYSTLIAEKLGLSSEEIEIIFYAAPMHDVGKIGIPDSILMKPAKLTPEEFEIMKTHTTIGAAILADSKADVLQAAQVIALSHHEKWNGQGYPRGLAGADIPLYGRIVGLPDVFDAVISKRPYKEPYPLEKALEIITEGRGTHFDPEVVDVFMDNLDQMLEIREKAAKDAVVPMSGFKASERDRC
ncbi:MAG: HD domain-containing protein [Proteobacteria bacterium]|nr:HD domain-containing protein [Pseudomonadota bacterium]